MNVHKNLKWKTIISRLNNAAGYKRFELEHKCVGAGILVYNKRGECLGYSVQAIHETEEMEAVVKQIFLDQVEHNCISAENRMED